MKIITTQQSKGQHFHLPNFFQCFNPPLHSSILLALFLFFSTFIRAQTTLAAGDIAVIGVNTSFNASGSAPLGPDEFAIVMLRDIASGTDIKITDHGWGGTQMIGGTVQDGIMSWTTTADIAAGTVFKFTVTPGTTPSLTISPNTFGTPAITARWTSPIANGAFSDAGDQVIIYQGGTDANPGTFIYGFSNSSSTAAAAGDWQPTAGGMVDSKLPPGLTNNTALDGTVAATAIAFTNNGAGGYFANNFVYTGSKAGTRNDLLKAIATRANWTYTTTLTTTYDLSVGGTNFTGSNPIFSLSVVPVKLLGFSGKVTAEGQLLSWKTAQEVNFNRYEVEKSVDGQVYTAIGYLAANGSNNYQFLATSSTSLRNYYRLKLVDVDDHFIYSPTILLMGQQEYRPVQLYPNPSTNIVTITSSFPIKQVIVLNGEGKTVLIIAGSKANTQSIPVQSLSAGTYLLRVKTDSGTELQKLQKL